MRKLIITALSIFSVTVGAEEVSTLTWADLIPESEQASFQVEESSISHSGETVAQQSIKKLRRDLGNNPIRIAGFVVPLEGDESTLTEFLLVPYFGACIHVPPPPSNQIIYVKTPDGVPVAELWDVVYVYGIIKAENLNVEDINTGYIIEGTHIEPYDGEGDVEESSFNW